MTKKKKKETLEDLIPDAALRERMENHLYSKKPFQSHSTIQQFNIPDTD